MHCSKCSQSAEALTDSGVCVDCHIDCEDLGFDPIVETAASQAQLLQFVKEVSGLLHEGEPGEDDQPHEPTSEDAIAALNQMILKARQLLGTAEKCGECGEIVAYVIGCPDGAEVCQDCFDAGQH